MTKNNTQKNAGRKAAAPATKKVEAKKTETPADDTLRIYVNKTGRVCFGRTAANRIGDLRYMTIAIDGKRIKRVATDKAREATVEIRRANDRPYISATKALKEVSFPGQNAAADPFIYALTRLIIRTGSSDA